MSLTSYRAAPPRVNIPPTSEGARCSVKVPRCARDDMVRRKRVCALGRPGSDLLSRVLRHSTIGAEGFHGRVRNGIGCSPLATTTRSSKRENSESPGQSPGHQGRQRMSTAARNERNQADRAIRTAKLNALLHLHTRPINVVVYHGSQRDLVSRRVSRLDAFSVYPFST